MRAVCVWLSGAVLSGALLCLVTGCGGGTSELEKPPEVKQNPSMSDMPGFNDMQGKLKKEGKIKK
jgi:hypothetical protein